VTDVQATPPQMGEVLADSPSNWGKWGDDDEVGCLNYLDAGQVVRAAKEVTDGKVFTLMLPIGDPKGDRRSASRSWTRRRG
jgi:hypothetical protein